MGVNHFFIYKKIGKKKIIMLAGRFRFFLKSSSTALSSLSSTTTTTTVSPISSSRQLLSLHQRTLATASNTKHSETASHGHDHHEHHDDHHDDHHHEHGKQPGGYLFNMKVWIYFFKLNLFFLKEYIDSFKLFEHQRNFFFINGVIPFFFW